MEHQTSCDTLWTLSKLKSAANYLQSWKISKFMACQHAMLSMYKVLLQLCKFKPHLPQVDEIVQTVLTLKNKKQ